MSCKIKATLFMPSDTFEQLLDRAASWFGIDAGFWDILGNHHTTSAAPSRRFCAPSGWPRIQPRILEQSLAALRAARMGAAAAARGGVRRDGPVELPLQRARGIAWRARALRSAARRRRRQRIRTQSAGTAASRPRSKWMAGRGCACRPRCPCNCRWAITRSSRKRGRAPARRTRYIVTPERAYTDPHLGARRARRRHRGQPVRRALGAQLGLRRFPRSARA